MSSILDSFRAVLKADERIRVYEQSVDEMSGTAAAIVRVDGVKMLAAMGQRAEAFTGEIRDGLMLAPLTTENSRALMEIFPYTKPRSHKDHPYTIGLGDRLGIATAGHVRAIKGYNVYPVLAQQSIRELTLTNRTFADVIGCAAFGVFQEGYKDGYGADGDHLKTKEEIQYALSSNCTMVTLDCSEHIVAHAATDSDEEISAQYAQIPEQIRRHYEQVYLGVKMPIIGELSEKDLRRVVVEFWDAINHAQECYRYIDEIKTTEVDFELSIDETLTITTPAEHFVIANELSAQGICPVSVAPHFNGAFEKGIDYAGDLEQFNKDLTVHQEIADHFGYKLSLHSGSDKFMVFSTWGRIACERWHVKTAGTNWLEALKVVARNDPALFRRTLAYSMEHRSEAEKYYHVSTDPSLIPDPDLESDAYLPEYLANPSSRQTLHITYGQLLSQDWFREEFFRLLDEHEEDYYQNLQGHIGKHLRYLTAEGKA